MKAEHLMVTNVDNVFHAVVTLIHIVCQPWLRLVIDVSISHSICMRSIICPLLCVPVCLSVWLFAFLSWCNHWKSFYDISISISVLFHFFSIFVGISKYFLDFWRGKRRKICERSKIKRKRKRRKWPDSGFYGK